MTCLKIVFNSLATAALAAFAAACFSFLHALVTKPNMEAVGQGIMQAVGAGIVAGLAGLILGVVGSLLFPAAYTKVMVISLFVVVASMTALAKKFSNPQPKINQIFTPPSTTSRKVLSPSLMV